MKKLKLISTGLVVVLAASNAFAQSPYTPADNSSADKTSFPLEFGGSFWTRYELRNGYSQLGVSRGRFIEGDWLVYRARLKLATKALSIADSNYSTLVVFSPQADGFWGDQAGTISAPNLGIYEGFLRLQSPSLRLDVGHFALNYGDALVIGDLRWHQTARSFDGARLKWTSDDVWVEGFVTYLNEGARAGEDINPVNPLTPTGTGSIFGGDFLFGGVYSSLGQLIGPNTTLEPYALFQIALADDSGLRPAVQATLGVRALKKLGSFDFRLETGVQFGRRRVSFANPESRAWHGDFEVGYTPSTPFRVSLEALFATGDDPNSQTLEGWDELFPTTHKFLGLMDIIGLRTNVASWVLHGRYQGGPFTLKLDFHGFFRPKTFDGQDSFAGVESDFNFIYTITKGMNLRVLYALFIPGTQHFFPSTDNGTPISISDPAQYIEVQYGLEL